MLKRLVFILILFFAVFSYRAQSYRFKHITSEDGLSTNYVFSIIRDDKGFMWFGTQDGLCKYDGYQITVYKNDQDNSKSLSSSNIISLYQHRDKKIYIGTQNEGLNIYDPYKDSFLRIPVKGSDTKTLTDFQVNCFYPENDENIWIGTSNGVNLFNVKTLENKKFFFPFEKAVEVYSVLKFNNKLYIGTKEDGIWTINSSSKLEKIELNNGLDEYPSLDLKTIRHLEEYAGNIYMATYGDGVVMFDPATLEIEKVFKASKDKMNYNYIENIKIEDNSLFAITRDGFLVFDLLKGTHQRITKIDSDVTSISDDYLTSIYVDDQKNIWIGTFSGGINVSFAQSLKFHNTPKNITEQFENAFSIYETPDKWLWIGGEKYLKSFNKLSYEVKDYSFLIEESNTVLSLNSDRFNNIWIGTWGLGLIKYNLLTKKKESLLSETQGGTIVSLMMDKNNLLWAGSYGDGLFTIDPNDKIQHYSMETGLSSDNITAILKDSKNNIWLGTDGGGVDFVPNGDLLKQKAIVNYNVKESGNSICSNSIYSILEDKQNRIWFATNSGFSMFNPVTKTFTNYNEKNGLANNFVFSLLEDSIGNLWMSTNKGITKFNPSVNNYNESAFRNYDPKDGLLNTEFSQGAYCKLASGEMAFGGVKGVNIFNPKKIQDNVHVPPVYIVSYKRSGKDVPTDTVIAYKKFLKLNWRENYFQFELAALDYNAPYKNKYMYKLEGYDNDWSAPTNIRYVSYTELPGGEYVFKVKAANNDGVWNETPYSIYITVVPPFWKTTWFYILVSVLGLAGVIIFTQLRTRAIKKENKILESKVEERTKELAEKNRDITSSIEYANRIQEAILPSKNDIFSKFPDAFILYRPKDIVSGDFYWFGYKNNCKIFAVVDCTGHGVPGAFMSMIGHNILNQAVIEKGVTDPGQIITKLHEGVQDALKQGHNEIDTNDGMDVSIISVNEANGEVLWAGALRPAIVVRANGELEKLVGNRYSVGGAQLDSDRIFVSQNPAIQKGDTIYLFSDGYADQFGGDNGKKFMLKRFQDLLISIHKKEMNEQRSILEQSLLEWRGTREQVDDVLVAGIRF